MKFVCSGFFFPYSFSATKQISRYSITHELLPGQQSSFEYSPPCCPHCNRSEKKKKQNKSISFNDTYMFRMHTCKWVETITVGGGRD
jgi:hypothetical protein